MGNGWIRLDREMFESDIWHDVTTFRLFVYLLAKASYKDGVKMSGIELKQGQYLRSYRKLAEDLAYKEGRGTKTYSLKTIKKCISKLISAGRVNVQETERGTLFTIVDYAKYQGFSEDEKETVNTINSEVETNGKRTGNNNNNTKKYIEREREREDETNPFRMFEENIRMLNAYERESLIAWCNDFGDELVMEAIKYSIQQGARSYRYLDNKLRTWVRKGVKDKNDAWVAEMELEDERKRKVVNLPNRKVGVGGIDWDNI